MLHTEKWEHCVALKNWEEPRDQASNYMYYGVHELKFSGCVVSIVHVYSTPSVSKGSWFSLMQRIYTFYTHVYIVHSPFHHLPPLPYSWWESPGRGGVHKCYRLSLWRRQEAPSGGACPPPAQERHRDPSLWPTAHTQGDHGDPVPGGTHQGG